MAIGVKTDCLYVCRAVMAEFEKTIGQLQCKLIIDTRKLITLLFELEGNTFFVSCDPPTLLLVALLTVAKNLAYLHFPGLVLLTFCQSETQILYLGQLICSVDRAGRSHNCRNRIWIDR